jgi:hypothetical protein
MTRKRKDAKKRYTSPSFKVLDADGAKAELKAKGIADDPNVQRMLSLIEGKVKTKGRSKPKLDKSA